MYRGVALLHVQIVVADSQPKDGGLAQGDGVLGREAAKQHEHRHHDATAACASGGRQSGAEEHDDEQQHVDAPEVLPQRLVNTEAPTVAAGATAAVLRQASLALIIRRTRGALATDANHCAGAGGVG